MFVYENEFNIPSSPNPTELFQYFSEYTNEQLNENEHAIRFVISKSDSKEYHCELGIIEGIEHFADKNLSNIFHFQKRKAENSDSFNAVLLVPTGVGAEIGGHAGDAAPVARLLASACDTLITHPNVVNASDINEIPDNALYVEGSIITRLMMGSIGLQKVKSNRILVVIDDHKINPIRNAAINSVSAARSAYGLRCPKVVQLEPPIHLKTRYSSTGRASGTVKGLDNLCEILSDYRDEYDAMAISSVIDVPYDYHMGYFESKGEMVNPWGGIEAILTHSISTLFDIPSAHSPMFESEKIANMDPGIVDPRMSAEAVSMSFLQCILKGLMRSPRIIIDPEAMDHHSTLTAADISCIVIPDGCIGLPTLAALEHGIPVIAVRENENKMQNDLTMLPWKSEQLYIVENYWEAVGVMTALKAGIAAESVRRPIQYTQVETRKFEKSDLDEGSMSA